MKQTGLFGKGSGKLGSAVFAISGGEQIVREYNPRVSNPNTEKQVEQRAKFKLLSQIAAVFAPILGFRKNKLVSARNQFVSANYENVTYENGDAQAFTSNMMIAPGAQTLKSLAVNEGETNQIIAVATPHESTDVAAVVFACVVSDENSKLQIANFQVITTPDAQGKFTSAGVEMTTDCVVFAYGILRNGSAQVISYGNALAPEDANNIESSILSKLLSSSAGTTQSMSVVYSA